MPSEYEDLVAALKLLSIPFAECGWKTRPEGAYGVVQLDFENGQMNADGEKQDRSWEGSVDVFYPKLTDRTDIIEAVEETLATVCGSSWYMNSTQYETDTGLFHVEWVFEVLDTPTEPDEIPQQTEPEGDG